MIPSRSFVKRNECCDDPKSIDSFFLSFISLHVYIHNLLCTKLGLMKTSFGFQSRRYALNLCLLCFHTQLWSFWLCWFWYQLLLYISQPLGNRWTMSKILKYPRMTLFYIELDLLIVQQLMAYFLGFFVDTNWQSPWMIN